jgi:hypothetical protein
LCDWRHGAAAAAVAGGGSNGGGSSYLRHADGAACTLKHADASAAGCFTLRQAAVCANPETALVQRKLHHTAPQCATMVLHAVGVAGIARPFYCSATGGHLEGRGTQSVQWLQCVALAQENLHPEAVFACGHVPGGSPTIVPASGFLVERKKQSHPR